MSLEKLHYLKRKKQMLAAASSGNPVLDDAAWEFIISWQVHELFDFILLQLRKTVGGLDHVIVDKLYKNTLNFLTSLPEEMRLQLLYDNISKEKDELLAGKLCDMAANLQLLDFTFVDVMLRSNDFEKQKRALKVLSCNKPFYNKQDIEKFRSLSTFIRENFPERGKRFIKKQLLSSKEKEMWTCECGNSGDIEFRCSSCGRDLFAFKEGEVTPAKVMAKIEERIELILEFIE